MKKKKKKENQNKQTTEWKANKQATFLGPTHLLQQCRWAGSTARSKPHIAAPQESGSLLCPTRQCDPLTHSRGDPRCAVPSRPHRRPFLLDTVMPTPASQRTTQWLPTVLHYDVVHKHTTHPVTSQPSPATTTATWPHGPYCGDYIALGPRLVSRPELVWVMHESSRSLLCGSLESPSRAKPNERAKATLGLNSSQPGSCLALTADLLQS